jgi:hypothetical protein
VQGSLPSLPALMHLDISSNQVAHIPKEILSLVSDNNAFCIVVDNNPLAEEDKSKLLALLQANKNRDRAESRTKGSRDILGIPPHSFIHSSRADSSHSSRVAAGACVVSCVCVCRVQA